MNGLASIDHGTSMIGMDTMAAMPYQSPWGWVYRLSRLNGMRIHQLCHMFRLPASVSRFFYGSEPLPWTSLHRCMKASRTGYESDFDPEAWRPYLAACRDFDSSWLRGCRTCLAFGYHTYVHQLPWVERCPWHGESLTGRCRCGRPLLSPRKSLQSQRLLACPCGHDHFDRGKGLLGLSHWPEAEVRRRMEACLRASQRARKRHVLSHAHGSSADPFALNEAVADLFRQGEREAWREVRVFDEVGARHSMDITLTRAILRRWGSVENYMTRWAWGLPLLSEDYERVVHYVGRISAERTDFPGELMPSVSEGVIAFQRDILLSAPSEPRMHGHVEASLVTEALIEAGIHLIHGIRDRLPCFRPFLEPWEDTVHGKILALALSDMTARVAMHGIQQLLRSRARRRRRAWGAPLALLTYRPTTRIRVGFQA